MAAALVSKEQASQGGRPSVSLLRPHGLPHSPTTWKQARGILFSSVTLGETCWGQLEEEKRPLRREKKEQLPLQAAAGVENFRHCSVDLMK